MTVSEEKVMRIFELNQEGKSLREIGREIGLSKDTVRKVLKSENTVSRSLEIKKYCLWWDTCEKLCSEECKSYRNAVNNKVASERLLNFLNERKEQRRKASAYYAKKWEKKVDDDES